MDVRHLEILRAIVTREAELVAEGRPTDFMLLQMAGPSWGLKPGIPNEQELAPREGDLLELADAGHLRDLGPSTSTGVLLKFAVTSSGRRLAAGGSVARDHGRPTPGVAPPSADDVLGWVADMAVTGPGSQALATGAGFINDALARYGEDQLARVAGHLVDLKSEGLVAFDDPMAEIDQVELVDRVGMAVDLRLTSYGRDRVRALGASTGAHGPSTVQFVFAEQAQVAARDVNNSFNTYDELLDRIAEALANMPDVSDADRDEAKSLLERLRGKADSVTTAAAGGAGGAVLGALFRQMLGLP